MYRLGTGIGVRRRICVSPQKSRISAGTKKGRRRTNNTQYIGRVKFYNPDITSKIPIFL